MTARIQHSRGPWAGRAFGIALSLAWLTAPINDLATDDPSLARTVLGVTMMAAFVGLYVTMLARRTAPSPSPYAAIPVLGAIAAAGTLTERPSWAALYVFVAVVAGMRLPPLHAGVTIGLSSVLAFGLAGQADGDWDSALSLGGTTLAIGFMMMAFRRLIVANRELEEAREELARMAVADERARFARDLHDLLGQSLSVIALKAQLAGRFLPDRPDDAAQQVHELGGVAREALTEVREAVSGYRRPTLAGELAGAKLALEAAGIDARFDAPEVTLPPEVEGVLAWTVREGTTNVIRHSGARRCRIEITAGLATASAEVVDDGLAGSEASPPGHGLAGLRERAERLAGRLEAGAADGGGFRLRVAVPVERRAAAA